MACCRQKGEGSRKSPWVLQFSELNYLLVHGYVSRSTKSIPQDISDLVLCFYYRPTFSNIAGTQCIVNGNRITRMIWNDSSPQPNTGFLTLSMPSFTRRNVEYVFQLRLTKLAAVSICIGIADAHHIERFINSDFAGSVWIANYSFCSNDGKLYSTETGCHDGVAYGQPFGENDVITVAFNPCHSRLQFSINGMKQPMIENVMKWKGLSYCLAVMMGHYSRSETVVDLLESPLMKRI